MSNAHIIKRLRALEVNAAMIMNDAATMRQELERADKAPVPRKAPKCTLTEAELNKAVIKRRQRISLI